MLSLKEPLKLYAFSIFFWRCCWGHPYSFISQQSSSLYDSKFELGCRRQGRSTLKTAESSSVNFHIQRSLSEESIFWFIKLLFKSSLYSVLTSYAVSVSPFGFRMRHSACFLCQQFFFCPLYGSYIATEKRKSGRTIFVHHAHTSRECELLVKLE